MSTELATNPGEAITPAPEVAQTTPETPTESVDSNVGEQPEGDVPAQLDDAEEVEYEGKRYKLPKEIAPALLRQADYTKKTQEVAELRRAHEAEKTRLAEEARAFQEDRIEHVQAYTLHQQLEQFKQVNWGQLEQDDPLQAQNLFRQYTMLRDAQRDVLGKLQSKQMQRQSQSAAEQAKLRDQTRSELAKAIPNWSPKAEQDLTDYAIKHGYKAEEVKAALDSDARPFRFLHKAFLYDQLVAKQAQAAKAQNPAEPVKPVGGNRAAPPIGLSDRLSTAEWVKRRNAEVAKKAGR
jgi:hypothetical protein